MTTQLTLLTSTPASWQIDPATRQIGHRGLAAARAVLAASAARATDPFRASATSSVAEAA